MVAVSSGGEAGVSWWQVRWWLCMSVGCLIADADA